MALPPPQTQMPMWEALRKQDEARKKAMMIQQAKEAGIPYSPHYQSLQNMEEPHYQAPQAPPQASGPAPEMGSPSAPPSSVAATGPGAAPTPNPAAPPPVPAEPGAAPYQSAWEQLGPEGIEAVLRGQAVQEEKQYADALRSTPGAEGRTVRNGIYVGASPLEHIAVGYRRHKGKKGVKKAQQEQQTIRKTIVDLLRDKMEPEESVAPTSMRDLL